METVQSAIRSSTQEGETFVYTSLGRWLLVSGYEAEWRAARCQMDLAPRVGNLTIIRGSTEHEFQQNCTA